MSKLCRTCLAEIPDTTYVMLTTENDGKAESVHAKLLACVPELQLNLVEEPVLCRNCANILELAYTFKIRCQLTEKEIQKYIETANLNGRCVTLTTLCSMQPNTESSYSVITSSEWRDESANDGTTSSEQFYSISEIPVKLENTADEEEDGLFDRGYEFPLSAIEDEIIKEEHDLKIFKVEELSPTQNFEDCQVNVDVPIKDCFVALKRLPVRESLENTIATPGNVGERKKKNNRTNTEEQSFRCKICEFISLKKLNLLEHSQTHRGKKGEYCCHLCKYSTAKRCYLIEHMSKHTGNKPFGCITCAYTTARKRNLAAHMIIHTGEKQFNCTTCSYKSLRKANLVLHSKIHTN